MKKPFFAALLFMLSVPAFAQVFFTRVFEVEYGWFLIFSGIMGGIGALIGYAVVYVPYNYLKKKINTDKHIKNNIEP